MKYLMILNAKARIINMLPKDTSERYAEVQKQFALDLGKPESWTDIVMFSLFDDQKISNVYYSEAFFYEGASFTLIKTPDVTNKDIEAAKQKLYSTRDVEALKVVNIKSLL